MFKKLLSFLGDALVYGSSNIIGQIIGFCLIRVYTRHLTPEDYGISAMLMIITMVFGPIANLGMSNAIFRRFSLEKRWEQRRVILSTGLCSVIISSLVLFAICQASAGLIARSIIGNGEPPASKANFPDFLGKSGDQAPKARTMIGDDAQGAGADNQLIRKPLTLEYVTFLVRLALISGVLLIVSQVPLNTLRADRRVKTTAVLSVCKLLTAVSLTVWLVVWRELGVLGMVLGSLGADAIFTVVQFAVTLGFFKFEASFTAWKEMLAYGLPFVPHHVQAVGLAQVAQYSIAQLDSLGEAGIYNLARQFSMPVLFAVNAIQSAWVAYKFQIHAEDDDPASFFRSMFTYYMAGVLYLWMGVSLWGPEVIRWLTPPNYHAAAPLVWAVALIPVSQGLFFMLGTGMEVSNNTKPLPLVSFAGFVTVVAGVFALVPWLGAYNLGAYGAAISTACGWLVMGGVVYVLAQRRFHIAYDWKAVVSCIVLAVILVTIGLLFQWLPTVPRIGMAIGLSLLYPLLVFGTLSRSPVEAARMKILVWRGLRWRRWRKRRSQPEVPEMAAAGSAEPATEPGPTASP